MENKNWLKKLFEKRKKGFTLIELLAIIVILAIIAVITVPIILNIIENAKKGAATNSAYGYEDAISKFYASKLSLDSTYSIPDGLHNKSDFDAMGVLANGKQPASNSFLRTYKNVVTSGCLQFDEYKVEFIDGNPQQAVKGECKTVNLVYTDVNENGKIDLADTVQIESDLFYIIDVPENGKVKLLPQYNLNSNSRQASSNTLSINFGTSEYWNGSLSNYPMDIYDTYYVYEKASRNNIYSYAENYKNYLIELGAYFVVDARPMSYVEARKIGCMKWDETGHEKSCATFAYNQEYWLGSAESGTNQLYFIEDGTNSGFIYRTLNSASSGVRPVIEIYESALTNNYTITFDSRGGTEVASKTIVTGTKIGTLPSAPEKVGATFDGWYADKEYTSEKITADIIPVGSTTYYARYVLTKAEYTDLGTAGINLGDRVKILDDEFYVIAAPSGGKVKLLAKYNLNANSRQENGHNVLTTFSNSTYWSSNVSSNYTKQSQYYYYVYRDKDDNDTNNNVKVYINAYKDYLNRQGAEFVTDALLMSYDDAAGMGCKTWGYNDSNGSCPSFAYGTSQSYWIGSTDSSDQPYYIENAGHFYRTLHNSTERVRPMIIINESALQ